MTVTMLRNLFVCGRRAHDVHANAALRAPVATSVAVLRADSVSDEAGVVSGAEEAVNLREAHSAERRRLTLASLDAPRAAHPRHAEVVDRDVLDRPERILRIDGGWICCDVRAGTPFIAGATRLKAEYASHAGLDARSRRGPALAYGRGSPVRDGAS